MARDERICEVCGKQTSGRDRWMYTIAIPGAKASHWDKKDKVYVYGDKVACDTCYNEYCQVTKGKTAAEINEIETAKIKAQNARLGRHIGDEVYDRHYKGE